MLDRFLHPTHHLTLSTPVHIVCMASISLLLISHLSFSSSPHPFTTAVGQL